MDTNNGVYTQVTYIVESSYEELRMIYNNVSDIPYVDNVETDGKE